MPANGRWDLIQGLKGYVAERKDTIRSHRERDVRKGEPASG